MEPVDFDQIDLKAIRHLLAELDRKLAKLRGHL